MIPLALALAQSAFAFAPSNDVYTGIEPQRVRWQHGPVQAALLQGDAYRHFAATDGAGWEARFDEATGTPRWLWGRGISIPGASGVDVARGVATVLERHRALLGFESLVLRTAHYNAQFDTWYLDFDAPREGLVTYRGGISARVKHGNLILVHVATSPGAPVVGAYRLGAADAIARAIGEGPAPAAKHTDLSAAPILLERASLHGLALVRTFEVRSRTADPPGIWVTFVDASSGEILAVHNEVRFATGTVTGLHHVRSEDGAPLVESPLPLVEVVGDVDADFTGEDGVYDVTDSLAYATDLHGDYVDIDNDAGDDAVLASDATSLAWTAANATQAEIDSYVFMNQVRLWGERVAPSVAWVSRPFESHVNVNSSCNAYWDGDTHFYEAGGGCNNTGENADVNYHEWGHGFHYYSIEAGIFDGSLSEGASDVVAFLQTGDNLIAPNFGIAGWAIRDVSPNRVFPQDFVNDPYYVHDNGLIFGGAMWDLRGLLIDELGEDLAMPVVEQIFTGLLKGGTDIPGTYVEALAADDDDGDLANGTPHQCTILDAFGLHGLGSLADGGVSLVAHEPLVNVPAGVATPITANVSSVAAQCVSVVPEDATVHFRVDAGPWEEVAASVAGAEVTGDIPGQAYGSIVTYWIEGADENGLAFTAPPGGQHAPYTFFVGETLEIDCHEFEAGDAGFVHSLVEGEETEGADDWQWGLPAGANGDPAAAFSGEKVWGNDLGHDNFNGLYQPDKVNRLLGDRVETGHYTGVFLQYRRWLNMEDAAYDQAIITANGEPVWTNWESASSGDEHHEDRQWVSHSVALGGLADRGDVQIGWELHSDGGLELGGWTLDDVCVLAPATPDNRLGIVDFTAEKEGAGVVFGWTNPVHAPVERVVVVRNFTGWPTAWDDGEIVLDASAPVAGERIEDVDATLGIHRAFYAVYANDGAAWLSWTIEGWNAALVEGLPYEPPAGSVDGEADVLRASGGGCGCAAPGAPPTGLPVLALTALALLRRRR